MGLAGIGAWIGAHAPRPLWRQARDVIAGPAIGAEQFLRPIAQQPVFQQSQMLRLFQGEGHLVRAPEAFAFETVNGGGTGPALGRAKHDHRPDRALRRRPAPGFFLNRGDGIKRLVQGVRQFLVHGQRIAARHEDRRIAIAPHQGFQFFVGNAGQQRGIGDLVAVEMQDRQHRAIGPGIEKLVAVPGGGQRAGFGFAVANDAGDRQIGIVERRAEGVTERIAQLAALMDRPGCFRAGMAGDPARKRELAEQPAHPGLIPRNLRIDFAIGSFQPAVGHQAGRAMARAGDEHHIGVAVRDDPVEMKVEEIEPGHRAPMTQQARLGVRHQQLFPQQGIGQKIDLTHRQVIRRPPPGMHPSQQFGRKRFVDCHDIFHRRSHRQVLLHHTAWRGADLAQAWP